MHSLVHCLAFVFISDLGFNIAGRTQIGEGKFWDRGEVAAWAAGQCLVATTLPTQNSSYQIGCVPTSSSAFHMSQNIDSLKR